MGRGARRGPLGLAYGPDAGAAGDARRGVAAPELRGAAFGLFNLVGGVATLLASLLAGVLWDSYGAVATFLASAGFALLALAALALTHRLAPALGAPLERERP